MKLPAKYTLAICALLLSNVAALAHAHLQTQTPSAGEVIATSPAMLLFGFTEGIELAVSRVTLTSRDGGSVPIGKPALATEDGKQVTVPLEGPLGAGTYTVAWHVLSRDGHISEGSYKFSVAP